MMEVKFNIFLHKSAARLPANSRSPCNGGGVAGKRSAPEPSGHPAPPKVSKAALDLSGQSAKKPAPISIKLGVSKPKEPVPALPAKKPSLASVFNEDEDSEPEEMPPEAKMRMKNIGRETPTSAGPNSFNKGKHGFSDHQKLWERKLKSQMD
ncbi:PEST proteolytic signal-containing nuclear protein isoform X5 [Scleropages formosus]|uniref:PEST proteolytic signal-containing nuclear protein isoform X5 n=1 Tax=Scleropages formosus TaxID=113540 RepID=UPI000878A648|nr:PEST proteolytic signal-containing nuclear protein isoform X5 [Scleropages formosus]